MAAPAEVISNQYKPDSENENNQILVHNQHAYAVHNDVVDPLDDDPVASVSFVQESPVVGEYTQSRPEGYYPYSSPPNPMSPNYPSGTYSVDADAILSINDIKDELFHGDAVEVLKGIPDEAFHGWVTSPPYPHSQRDYGVDGQIGIESTPGEYLENLLSVILQAMRVTRPDGTGWVIVDDAICNGEYIGVPDRLVAQLKDEGFKVIHNGPWVKTGRKPDPAPNRFAHTHERVIGIAKSDNYMFDRRAVEDQSDVLSLPTSAESKFNTPDVEEVSHDAMFSIELASHLITASIPKHTCPKCRSPLSPQYEVTDILDLKENRHKERVLDAFHRTPEMTRKHARACRSVGLCDAGQGARTQSGTGRNSNRVQQLVNEVRESDFPSSYIREFSYAKKHLTGYRQTCECSDVDIGENTIGGLVLDPFVGSGTTCSAAIRHGRHYTGIDLNEDYIDLTTKRLSSGVDSSLSEFF
ncbi:site-specific DNA-methyltransferase [Haloarcula sp. K1]|uniref:DNA-methyltransferase n=1 Tax=Haloarcula sp. K1 TaxID=1622207 RepID=UPI0007BC53C9|nr:site-specific DNA-methyltransferase [Haloarcula sp. K1]KZX46324.1 hypothetical protein AV929_16265 [Haloarcula sp. K1]